MLGSNRVYVCMTSSSSSNNFQQQAHALELSIQWTTLFLCCAKNMCQLLLLPGIKYMLYCCELCGHNLWSMVVICAFRYLGQVWRNTERERSTITTWPHGGSKVDNIYELWKCAQRIPQFFGVNAGNGLNWYKCNDNVIDVVVVWTALGTVWYFYLQSLFWQQLLIWIYKSCRSLWLE